MAMRTERDTASMPLHIGQQGLRAKARSNPGRDGRLCTLIVAKQAVADAAFGSCSDHRATLAHQRSHVGQSVGDV